MNKNDFFDLLIKNNVRMQVKPINEQKSFIRPEDDYDFHAYRILLLIHVCGRIISDLNDFPLLYGRNKFAFFDFLIRYPSYLKKTIELKNKVYLLEQLNIQPYEKEVVLLPMIRYLRGPWDHRYNSLFNYMISKRLIQVKIDKITPKSNKQIFCLMLTKLGNEVAQQISLQDEEWASRMEIINKLFGKKARNETINKFIETNFKELIIGSDVYDY